MIGLHIILLAVVWTMLGCALAFALDTSADYDLSMDLYDRLPAWTPRCTPQLLMSVFWPITIVWVFWRYK